MNRRSAFVVALATLGAVGTAAGVLMPTSGESAAVDKLRWTVWDTPRLHRLSDSDHGDEPSSSRTSVKFSQKGMGALVFDFDCLVDQADGTKGESVEVCLNPSADRRTFYRIAVDVEGKLSDARGVWDGPGRASVDPSWESQAKVQVKRRPDGWHATVEIPYEPMKTTVLWEFPVNVCRTRTPKGGAEPVTYSWSPSVRSRDHVDAFGTIVLEQYVPTPPRSVVRVRGLRSETGTRDNTFFEMVRDGADVVFRFVAEDETPCVVPDAANERDLEAGDRLEVFLSAREDLKDWYYCFEFDLAGKVLDYRTKFYRQTDYGWTCPTLRTKASKKRNVFFHKDVYTVEARVAVAELEKLGLDVDLCTIGVFRADARKLGDEPAWYSAVPFPPDKADFHRPVMLRPVGGLVAKPRGESLFKTRGVVVYTADLSCSVDWPKLAHDAGVSTIATHFGPGDAIRFMQSERGRRFMDDCARYGIQVEHELHSMYYFVPRSLFASKPELFRVDEKGVRNKDGNFCVSNPEALALAVSNAVKTAKICTSTTGRYFFWRDDGPAMACHCPACSRLSVSEQALVVENAMVRALRAEVNPNATLAHLAYGPTCAIPVNVKPDPALFLEYAPFKARSQHRPLDDRNWAELDALLELFPAETAQILDYWLDESLACHFRRFRLPIVWNEASFRADVSAYASRGIRHITTFAAWMDDAFRETVGDYGPVYSYGRILSNWR